MTTLTNETLYGDNMHLVQKLIAHFKSEPTRPDEAQALTTKRQYVPNSFIGEQLRLGNAFVVPAARTEGNQSIDDIHKKGFDVPADSPLQHKISMVSDDLRKAAESFKTMHFGYGYYNDYLSPAINDRNVDEALHQSPDLGRVRVIFLQPTPITNLWRTVSFQTNENLLLQRLEAFSRNVASELKSPDPQQVTRAQMAVDLPSPLPAQPSSYGGGQ